MAAVENLNDLRLCEDDYRAALVRTREMKHPDFATLHSVGHGPLSSPPLNLRALTIPEIILIGGTRVALGAGMGLLLSDRRNDDQSGAGWALRAVGALTTIPLVISVLNKPPVSGPLINAIILQHGSADFNDRWNCNLNARLAAHKQFKTMSVG